MAQKFISTVSFVVQLVGAVEYIDCISTPSVLNITVSQLMVRLQYRSIPSLFVLEYTLFFPGHWPNEYSVRQWPGRPGFNPRLSHTKDSKNGT